MTEIATIVGLCNHKFMVRFSILSICVGLTQCVRAQFSIGSPFAWQQIHEIAYNRNSLPHWVSSDGACLVPCRQVKCVVYSVVRIGCGRPGVVSACARLPLCALANAQHCNFWFNTLSYAISHIISAVCISFSGNIWPWCVHGICANGLSVLRPDGSCVPTGKGQGACGAAAVVTAVAMMMAVMKAVFKCMHAIFAMLQCFTFGCPFVRRVSNSFRNDFSRKIANTHKHHESIYNEEMARAKHRLAQQCMRSGRAERPRVG